MTGEEKRRNKAHRLRCGEGKLWTDDWRCSDRRGAVKERSTSREFSLLSSGVREFEIFQKPLDLIFQGMIFFAFLLPFLLNPL